MIRLVLGVNAKTVLHVCKLIAVTLTKFKDQFSQNLVKGLIQTLLKHQPEATIDAFGAIFKALVQKELPSAPPLKGGQAALIALGWAVLITVSAKTEGTEKKLLEHQLGLYQIVVAAGNEKLNTKGYEIVKELFEKVSNAEKFYWDKLQSAEPSAGGLLFLLAYAQYAKDESQTDLVVQNKAKLIEYFIKGLVSVKVKPNVNHFTACRVLLNNVNKEEFKSSILPALSRAMLRSPEIILQGVGAIVQELDLDLSDCSMDLGKTLIQNLYSKDDTARHDAVESLRYVANKCSDAKAIEVLVKQAFAVLNGSEGKITVAEYRINILQV